MHLKYRFLSVALSVLISACTGLPKHQPESTGEETQAQSPTRSSGRIVTKKGGGYYQDDGPADEIPDNLDDIPDAQPMWEPLHKPAMRPYEVLGRRYVPHTSIRPYKARGMASWYGKKFHGKKTSTGETYDMFAMTAAHTTLALPSYVRVTHLRNGRSVVVRVNDRGPFHVGRIIDLSYSAAHKLGIINSGSSEVQIEAIIPSGSAKGASVQARASAPAAANEGRDGIAELMNRLEKEETRAKVSKGIFLQIGAFANADNAENLKNRLASELDWLAEHLHIFAASGMHRLQLGPYASREEALRIAERIQQSLGTQPAVVVR